MKEPYIVVSSRIKIEIESIEKVIERIERGMMAGKRNPNDLDFYIDSIALNLHDFYSAIERMFYQIASIVDNHIPSTKEWHRDLLYQMRVEIPNV
jgi:hypothetical protein